MAIIRKQELHHLTKEELKQKLDELQLELLKLKAQKGFATSGTKSPRELKRTIARIHTQLKQLERQKT